MPLCLYRDTIDAAFRVLALSGRFTGSVCESCEDVHDRLPCVEQLFEFNEMPETAPTSGERRPSRSLSLSPLR